jgi:thiosulfate/3-mercaptopyruvate sulfurtransferase
MLLAFIGAALLPLSAVAFNVPGPLVETDWVEANLKDVVVLDVRKKAASDTKRIAGATLVPWKKVRAKRSENGVELIKMLPTKEAFEDLMQSLGVNNDSAIIVTSESKDASTTFLGTRLYWQLKYFGHDNVALLNGGNAKWFKEKRATSTTSSARALGDFTAAEERSSMLATTADVEKAVNDDSVLLIDTRSQDQYLGLFYKKSYVYAPGHIPGAKSVDGDIFLKYGKIKTFHKPDKIQMAMTAKGVPAGSSVIAYCNSGHMSAGVWFIQSELLGNTKATMYDGSMHEWTKDSSRSVVSMKME